VRLLPYRTTEDRIEGAIMTFFDITARRQAEELRPAAKRACAWWPRAPTTTPSSPWTPMAASPAGTRAPSGCSATRKTRCWAITLEILFTPEDRERGAARRRCARPRGRPRPKDERWHLRKDGSRFSTNVDLSGVLRDIHNVVINEQHLTRVDLQLPDEPLIVHADPTRVEQIIWNLVNNALKFTPPTGHIHLIASRNGQMAQLDIKDNGVGIAADNLEHVFDLFGQAEKQHTNHQREGLGIGLSLVRQLTEAQHGTVQVTSPGLGAGCTFSVRLPLADLDSKTAPEPVVEIESGKLDGLQILLVDDSPEVLETLKMLLEMEDAEVMAFDHPVEALKAAEDNRFDLIISDLGMPVMTGHELMSALRQLPLVKNVPAIALTGYGTNTDIQKSHAAGFDEHIGKPVSYDDLIETIEALRRSKLL
jgi:two-component system CheB/CheR fusion protein